jgi:hypothetical protein
MLTRRRLLAGAATTAFAFTGIGRGVSDPSTAITVYKCPT